MMIYGYGMKCLQNEHPEFQFSVLKDAGAKKIFIEKNRQKDLPQFNNLLKEIKIGDELILWKIAVIGRSFKEMTTSLKILLEKGIHIKCISGDIDISEEYIKPVLDALIVFIDFDRAARSERTKEGQMIARSKGHIIGRKKGVPTNHYKGQPESMLDLKERVMLAQSFRQENTCLSLSIILSKLKISKSNYYRYYKIDPNVSDCKTDR
ncbi:Site-specific DNA recombinase [Mucilaginibacter lappiensis]|nr:Site-specific DNA recombinase [Mucilaginibacter lappiensis]